jgi:ribosomal protein S20
LVRTKIKQVVAAIDADNAQEAQAAYDSAGPCD